VIHGTYLSALRVLEDSAYKDLSSCLTWDDILPVTHRDCQFPPPSPLADILGSASLTLSPIILLGKHLSPLISAHQGTGCLCSVPHQILSSWHHRFSIDMANKAFVLHLRLIDLLAFLVCGVQGIKPRTLCMLDECSTTEPHSQPTL
jgi:hypothetical protein